MLGPARASFHLDARLTDHPPQLVGGLRHQFLMLRVTRPGDAAVDFADWLSHCTSSLGARADGTKAALNLLLVQQH